MPGVSPAPDCPVRIVCFRGGPLPIRVCRENVVAVLGERMARETALSIVSLGWFVSQSVGSKRIRCGVVAEHGPSPPAAICEPLAVLSHEINLTQRTRLRRLAGVYLVPFRVPTDLRQLGAVWKALAVTGEAVLVGVDHHRISKNHSDQAALFTSGDYGPALVSPELRECQPVRHCDRIFVRSGRCSTTEDSEGCRTCNDCWDAS